MAERGRDGSPGRRWLRWPLPLLLAVLAAYSGWHYLSRPEHLPLRVIDVTGQFTHLRPADIEARVARAVAGAGFLSLDMRRVRDLVEALPWVDQVSVRRVWPDTLRMEVIERIPLARWNDDALLDLHRVLFRPDPMPRGLRLPVLRGEDARATEVGDFYLRLSLSLPGTLEIAEVALNARGEWRVRFRDGLELMLGGERLERRIEVFRRLYPLLAREQGRRPERIDMRYEHGLAVRWRPVETGSVRSLAGKG